MTEHWLKFESISPPIATARFKTLEGDAFVVVGVDENATGPQVARAPVQRNQRESWLHVSSGY